jgi:hypothetical protein
MEKGRKEGYDGKKETNKERKAEVRKTCSWCLYCHSRKQTRARRPMYLSLGPHHYTCQAATCHFDSYDPYFKVVVSAVWWYRHIPGSAWSSRSDHARDNVTCRNREGTNCHRALRVSPFREHSGSLCGNPSYHVCIDTGYRLLFLLN